MSNKVITKHEELQPEWQAWIKENLELGCTVESIVEQMVLREFDHAFASAAVQILGNESNASYRYEQPKLRLQGNIVRTKDRAVRIGLRLDRPRIVVLDNLLTAGECDELVRLSENKLTRSMTVDPSTGKEIVIKERTSRGAYFARGENKLIAKLERRLSEVTGDPVSHGEGIQVLNYQAGAEYRPHFDYFPHTESGSAVHLSKGGQRIGTVVMYLNDVEEGGATTFPTIGVSVVPKKGSAVYFEYGNSLGQLDELTLHAGSPVVRGEKWIATKWIRERPYE